MKKTNKARKLILYGVTLHLKNHSLKKINHLIENNKEYFYLENRDKSFVKFITLNTIRNRGIIEKVLNLFLSRPLPKKIPEIKAGLMLGISQILFSRVESHAAVNTTIDLFTGKIEKWRGLANAILRKVSMQNDKIINIKSNLLNNIPSWLIEKWENQFGQKITIQIINAIFDEPTIDLKFKNDLLDTFDKIEGIKLENNTLRILNKGLIKDLPDYVEGKWWVQDVSAQLPVTLFGNIKNKKILEICAAPGGKTCQMLDKGAKVTAVDKSSSRISTLEKNVARLKLKKNLILINQDALDLKVSTKYEFTLLDVPCSATGTIKRNPDILWFKNQKDIQNITFLQKALLQKSINLTKRNGIIIYSNCSLEFEEGEEIIDEFVKKKEVEILEINKEEITGYPPAIIKNGYIRTLPHMYYKKGGMDGFFVARLKKISHN